MQYNQILTDKINGYKSYNQAVKVRVLKQIPQSEVNELMYKKALKQLPKVMKQNAIRVKQINLIKKTVKGLERHAYAPEMNTLHFVNGSTFKVPQITTIENAIEKYLNQ